MLLLIICYYFGNYFLCCYVLVGPAVGSTGTATPTRAAPAKASIDRFSPSLNFSSIHLLLDAHIHTLPVGEVATSTPMGLETCLSNSFLFYWTFCIFFFGFALIFFFCYLVFIVQAAVDLLRQEAILVERWKTRLRRSVEGRSREESPQPSTAAARPLSRLARERSSSGRKFSSTQIARC